MSQSKPKFCRAAPDIVAIARAAGLTVVLDGQIGRERYESVSGSVDALQRFADLWIAAQVCDDEAQILKDRARPDHRASTNERK